MPATSSGLLCSARSRYYLIVGLIETVTINQPRFGYDGPVIERTLQAPLVALARRYPVVTLTGPRQSGPLSISISGAG